MVVEIPLSRPSILESEIAAVSEVLRSGWLAHGPWNKKFEQAFASLIGVPHAISMNSCTSALEVALKANDIKGEVIVPSMTRVATANAVVNTGGSPVFCEVDPRTRNMTAAIIAEHVTPRTEAVIVVHFAGQPCQMDEIVSLCERHNLLLIEDSAETLGATWKGRQAGSFGIGCYSFFPTKNITTAEGGMFTCHDDRVAATAREMIAHGMSSTTFAREKVEKPWLRAAVTAGHNYRMPNPLAVLGYHQLMRLEDLNHKRRSIAERYNEGLAALGNAIRTPMVAEGATHVYQMYTVEVDQGVRDAVVQKLRARGIGASVHFDPPVHLQPFYLDRGGHEGMLPATEKLARELITLPHFPDMTDEEVEAVIAATVETVSSVTSQELDLTAQ